MEDYAVYAGDRKDIPEWLRNNHDWQNPVDVKKLEITELSVQMCCPSCQQKVLEKFRNIRGVFDVNPDRPNSRVTVVSIPGGGLDVHELLKQAKKIDKEAKILVVNSAADPKPKPKPKPVEEPKPLPSDYQYGYWALRAPVHEVPQWIHGPRGPVLVVDALNLLPRNHPFVHHPVYCHWCVGYANVACGNCGRNN
jgi:hypothetical protein